MNNVVLGTKNGPTNACKTQRFLQLQKFELNDVSKILLRRFSHCLQKSNKQC